MFLGKNWMKGFSFYTAVVTLVSIASCKSPEQKIMDEFKKVDSSLQSPAYPAPVKTALAITPVGDSLRRLHIKILAKQQANPHLAVMADSIFVITSYAVSYMDSLKQVLFELDSAGETSVATGKVFGNATTGKLLYQYLLQVRHYTIRAVITKSRQAQIDIFFAFEEGMPDDKIFVKRFFSNTPDVGTLTILSKFQNDGRAAAILALTDINEAIAKTQ